MENLLSYAEKYLLESLLISLVLGVVMTGLIAWFWWRKSHAQILQLADEKMISATQLQQQQLQQLQNDKDKLHAENQQRSHELLRLNKLAVKLAEQYKHSQEKAQLADGKQQALSQAEMRITQLQSELEHQSARFSEQTEFIRNAQKTLSDHFSTLGQKILEEKTLKFTDHNQKQMNLVVNPLQKQLQEFQLLINRSANESLVQQKAMKSEIERIYLLNQELSQKATDLTQALTSESKTQGNWGELILHRLLDVAGLEQGREYDTEVSFTSSDNKRYRPDVLIHLPQEKTLIIDAKVSLTAFERYVNAEDDEVRQQQLNQHVLSMKTHIDGLTKRNYQNIEQIDTLDFVLMFVPIESAFLEAINAQPNLLEEAYKKNVLVVSASNLLATLRTVMVLWQNENQNKNAQVIAEHAGKMYDKFVAFVEDLNEVKLRIRQTDDALDAAENKLKTGRGNLISRADKLKQLGARNSKQLQKD